MKLRTFFAITSIATASPVFAQDNIASLENTSLISSPKKSEVNAAITLIQEMLARVTEQEKKGEIFENGKFYTPEEQALVLNQLIIVLLEDNLSYERFLPLGEKILDHCSLFLDSENCFVASLPFISHSYIIRLITENRLRYARGFAKYLWKRGFIVTDCETIKEKTGRDYCTPPEVIQLDDPKNPKSNNMSFRD